MEFDCLECGHSLFMILFEHGFMEFKCGFCGTTHGLFDGKIRKVGENNDNKRN
jgi:ribosomal protein S27E